LAASALESVLKRDRLVVLASLSGLAIVAWLYLFHLAADMAAMQAPADSMADMPGMEGISGTGMASAPAASGALAAFVFLAIMWIVMMVGMMLPSAAATILLFAAVERKRQAAGPYNRTALFICGYFVVWGVFSILAAAAQTALSHAGMLSAEMAMTGAIVSGAVFVLAGLYEFSPLKESCLTHCRSPLEWIAHHQRPGGFGAFRMGGEHGLYCVGCCWMLMLLLFVGGVMNLLWVAAIAAIVLAEKLLPRGPLFARLAGAVLIVIGVGLILRPLLAA
jgi:predicted metal-binding membrane protein